MIKSAASYKNPEKQKLSEKKEQLFQHKKKWNKELGVFQKELSNFQKELRIIKNLINGRIEGKEKLKLHQPLPEETIKFLDNLKSKSPSYLANSLEEAKEIAKEQYLYARDYHNFYLQLEEKRKQKMEKKNAQLNYNLISEGVRPLMKWASSQSSVVKIKGIGIPTVLAVSETEQMKGLMNCYELPPSMSFVYKYPKVNKFWMHNTPQPLDIVFCNDDKIIHIAKGEPFSTKLVGPDDLTNLIVEFPYGTCKKLGFNNGDEVILLGKESIFEKKNW